MLTYADIAGSNGSARLGADNVSGTLKTSNEWVLTVAYADGFRPPWIGWAVVLAGNTHFTCFTSTKVQILTPEEVEQW
jgi:hypothetical protein